MGRILSNKRKYLRIKILGIMIIVGLVLVSSFVYLDRKITPSVQAIGELKAQEITTRAINESISTVLKEDIRYQDLIFVKEDEEGNVTMMQANTFLMNKVASDVALTIQGYLKQIQTTSDRIPLGNAFGSQLFAQYGPKMKLTVTPLGMVNVNFGTEFEESGINQTRHRIYLIINTSVRVMVPFSSNTIKVTTYFPIAETIIVGKVPMNYVNVPGDEMSNFVEPYE